PISQLFPYTTLFRSRTGAGHDLRLRRPLLAGTQSGAAVHRHGAGAAVAAAGADGQEDRLMRNAIIALILLALFAALFWLPSYAPDRKSTRLNSSHVK